MLLGGLQKHSLIDYPGKLSCVCFLSGCNFRCPYCHNPDLALGKIFPGFDLDEGGFFRFLQKRSGLLDAVVISGGEPTLQTDLPSFCSKIKGLGFSVKLDTNGSRPRVIRELLDEGLVDYVAMDLKTDLTEYPMLMNGDGKVNDILESVKILMDSPVSHEFRTTCVRPLVDPVLLERMARLIQGAALYALQPFHPGQVLNPGYFQDMDPGYCDAEMSTLKGIASPFVRHCRLH